jgi:gliding motility-associated-like protein
MKKKLFLIYFLCICVNSFGQNEAANWYFGFGGGLRFDQGTNSVFSIDDGQLNTFEGCTSISDNSGDLLFYTDGIVVFNRNHTVMPNGSGLLGDPSSSQSAIIVPKPNDPNIFYVFTVDDHSQNAAHFGLNYSEIDMSLDGGLGDVTTNKNINLLQESSEKITAVLKDCITKSIWVVAFSTVDGNPGGFNTYHAFEVNDLGIDPVSVKSTFNLFITDNRGYLKLSPDGTKMASANASEGLFLYDFDTNTGFVSNQIPIGITGNSSFPYGLEFSPNSSLLYVHASNDFFGEGSDNPSSHTSSLIQYNLLDPNVANSGVIIDNRNLYRGALQLGPNGKIYRALSSTYGIGLPFLGVINNPDAIGTACNYVHNAINLSPNLSAQGLPPFIASFFNKQIDIIKNGQSSSNLELCDGDSYFLTADDIPGASYTWTQNGNLLPETSFSLEVFNSGQYEVYIDPNNGDCAIEGQAFVNFNPNPDAFSTTLVQCDEDGVKDGFTIFNLTEANETLSGGLADRAIKFYTDSSRTNEVSGNSFSNTLNPQTIYVEVIDTRTGCQSDTELILDVTVTDSQNTTLIACDDDGTEDGLYNFILTNAEADILNGLPIGLSVSYYETYEDALLEENSLGITFKNSIPYSQTIYARVENANDCYGISEILLTVNELPDIITEDLAYYCLNKFPETISINAGLLQGFEGDFMYSWSTGETSYEIEINEPGNYSVVVTNSNNCSKERIVRVEPSNIASFESIDVVDVSQNNTITVITTGEGTYEYALLDSNNILYRPYQTNNTFENIKPGIYTVYVQDVKNNCGSVNDKVSVIGFPKYFTPNNDGVNDTWQVYGVSDLFQPNSLIHIYDRYGKLLKQLVPSQPGWDGLFNGQKLPSDDYWFSVTLQDGRIFKSHFTLKN